MNPDQRRRWRKNQYYLDPVTGKPEPWVRKQPCEPWSKPMNYLDELDEELRLEQVRIQRLGNTPQGARARMDAIRARSRSDLELMRQQLQMTSSPRNSQGAEAMPHVRIDTTRATERRSEGPDPVLENFLDHFLPPSYQRHRISQEQEQEQEQEQGAQMTPQINTSRMMPRISEESPRISEESPRIQDIEGSPISLLGNSNKKKNKCCNIMGGSTRRPKSKSKSPKPKNRSRRRKH